MTSERILALKVGTRVKDVLDELCARLVAAGGDNVRSVVVCGGVARGRYVEGRSDVNLVLVLKDASAGALAVLSPALRVAHRAARVEPLILTEAEVKSAADVFPTRFFDIQAHHLPLVGDSPFLGLTISREHLRLRVEQELRNLAMRLRRRFIAAADEPATLASVLRAAVSPLAVELAALLRLRGADALADDTPADVFSAAAAALDLDGGALAELARLKATPTTSPDAAAALFPRVLAVVTRAAQLADESAESVAP